ncbi:MAG: alkaline phosphatase family protein [Phycisphaerae bacterium]
MNRVCVIDIAALSPRLATRVDGLWINSLPSRPRAMKPTLPAVAASVQASMTTGAAPGQHGVIGGGLFRRGRREVSLDERSNTLLAKKRFWHARRLGMPKTALVFWTNPLAGAADFVLGAMTNGPSGVSLADLPVGLYARLAAEIGPCDTALLRGPGASWPAAGWIADAAASIWREQKPQLAWVYMPGVDFEAVRHGVDSAHAAEALRVLDLQAHRLAEEVAAGGGRTVIVSDGGYVNVSTVAFPNIRLHQAGLLKTVQTDLGEMADLENSAAFAMVDHQIGYVYCADAAAVQAAGEALAGLNGVAQILRPSEALDCGIGCERAGDIMLLARPDAWLSYRWWPEDDRAPRAADRWDVQGKLGHDPCELFAAPFGEEGRGQQSDAGRIDPNPARVRASRGLVPPDPADHAVLAATCEIDAPEDLKVTDLPRIVERLMLA